MVGEMDRNQLMQNLFGCQSDEENEQDKGLEPEHETRTESWGEAEVGGGYKQKGVVRNKVGSSRLPNYEKEEDLASFSAKVIHDVFGDCDDDELAEYPVQNDTKTKNNKGKGTDDLLVGNPVANDPAEYDFEDKDDDVKLKGKATGTSMLLEVPLRPPPADRDEMVVFQLSNLIGIDPKPFDPSTYVEEDYYVADTTGTRKHIPGANIIRWREVTNPDGTTSAETNARFITWSDSSMQLFIGNESFVASVQDATDIQNHLFLRHTKGIYQSQGRIPRKMKFMPSSLTSDSHRRLTALVESRHKKVNKVQQYTPDIDPERLIQQQEKAAKEIIKTNKQLTNKKKKVKRKYAATSSKERQLSPGFLEDAVDEHSAAVHLSDLDLSREAAAESRIMKAKMGPKDPHQSSSSMGKLTREQGAEVSLLPQISDEIQEGINIEPYEDSDFEAEEQEGKESRSNMKKKVVIDEDSPPRRTTTRRSAIMYSSSDE